MQVDAVKIWLQIWLQDFPFYPFFTPFFACCLLLFCKKKSHFFGSFFGNINIVQKLNLLYFIRFLFFYRATSIVFGYKLLGVYPDFFSRLG
mgnify:CR=1 FL=1